MKAIIINRSLSSEETQFLQPLRSEKYIVFYTTSTAFSSDPILPDISEEAKREINTSALKAILDFGKIKLEDKTIAQFLTLKGAGTWYYHKFRIYFNLRNLLYQIEAINSLANNFKSVVLYTDNRILKEHGLLNTNVEIHFSITTRPKVQWKIIWKYTLMSCLRLLRGFLQYRRIKNKPFLFIESPHQYKLLVKGKNLKPELENAFLGPIYEKEIFQDNIGILNQYILPSFTKSQTIKISEGLISTSQNVSVMFSQAIYFIQYLKIHPFFLLFRIVNALRRSYQEMDQISWPSFHAALIYQIYRSLHGSTLFFLFKYVAYREFLKSAKAKVIVTIDEYSPNFKIILDAAKWNKIHTLAVQHGTMHRLHPAYRFTTNDMRNQAFPDTFLVWGSLWKDFLINTGNVDEKRIDIIGQPRTDYLYEIRKNNLHIRDKLTAGKNGTEHIIMFASQPQRDESLRRQAAADVFQAVKGLPNTLLVLKMHPREQDEDYYRDIAMETGCTNYVIENNTDLYVLINSVDIVITCFSTVGTEALYFRKPVVILDHLKQDLLGLCEAGVAIQASDAAELSTALQEIFNGKLKVDKKVLDDYLTKIVFRVDGKVADRFWEHVKGI